jgi:hypothetical protein
MPRISRAIERYGNNKPLSEQFLQQDQPRLLYFGLTMIINKSEE